MHKFQLSAEKVHLLQKVAKKERDPIEIFVCTIFSSLLFLYVYLLVAYRFRYEEGILAMLLGPALVFVICVWLSLRAYKALKITEPGHRRSLWINMAICSWAALLFGFFLADRSFWQYATNIWSYRDLVSYVDINPSRDNGQSYMDSGHLYFKEQSKVLRQKFTSFKNGDTYCVAPIIRGSFLPQASSDVQTMNGFVLPDSGTYDWWAVGTNCCDGLAWQNFTCGAVNNPLARSGMRLLSDSQRPYFVLAVQEWSATYGLPVKHPLFFTWVKDPLETEEGYANAADNDMWIHLLYFMLGVFIFSFLLHMLLHQSKIY